MWHTGMQWWLRTLKMWMILFETEESGILLPAVNPKASE